MFELILLITVALITLSQFLPKAPKQTKALSESTNRAK